MMRYVAIFVALIVLINAHGWVNSPVPRGYTGNGEGSASTTAPCGKAGTYDEIVTVTSGDSIEVLSRTGGGHTGQTCSFSIGSDDTDPASFNQYPDVLTRATCPAASTFTDQVPINVPAGTWYLQWNWQAQGSSWYNCIQLNVLDSGITLNDVTPGQAITGTCTSENLYYRIPLTSYQSTDINLFVSVENKGTTPITMSVSTRNIPMDTNDGLLLSAPIGSQINAPVCLGGQNAQYAYVTVFGGCTGSFDLSVNPYEAYLDLALVSERTVSMEAGSTTFYFSPTVTTVGKSKRIVFSGSGASSCRAAGPFRTCEDYIQGETVRCIDLPLDGAENDYGTNYYGIECTSAFEGKVAVERGTCSTWEEPDSGFAMAAGLVMLLLALFV